LERFHISAKKIEEAAEDCKSNNGIKVIYVGHKPKTVCKNGATFVSRKEEKAAR